MKYLMLSFILLLISFWVGLTLAEHGGYVLINYGTWQIVTSVWVAAAILIVSFLVLYFTMRLMIRLFGLSADWRKWWKMRRYQQMRYLMNRGIAFLMDHNFSSALDNLEKSARIAKYPCVNYLLAARAAHQNQDDSRRDRCFQLAAKNARGILLKTVHLQQAEIQIDLRQWERAQATVLTVLRDYPSDQRALQLLKEIYFQLNEWSSLLHLLPALKKYGVYSKDELDQIEKTSYQKQLSQANFSDISQLQQFWQNLPKRVQQDANLQIDFVKQCLLNHGMEEATAFIENRLKKEMNLRLIELYGQCYRSDSAAQLKQAEKWLDKYNVSAELLLCLARLSYREKLWGKARDYGEQSIALKPNHAAYLLLGETYEKLNNDEKAAKTFREGLSGNHS